MGNFIAFFVMEVTLHILHYICIILIPFIKLNKVKKGDEGNIVLLHGWMAGSISLFILKMKLEKLGYTVYTPDFSYSSEKIEKLAGKLDRYVKTNKLKNFTLIGHSMGGLIGLYYYQNYKNNISKLISLGCPFHGTDIARIAFFSESAKQIIPGSKFIRDINKTKKYNKVYVIESVHDYITSAKSGHLGGAHNIKLKWVGHMSMIVSNEVFGEIKKILRLN